MQSSPIRRANVSETVADELREMILDGRLAPSQRLKEVELALALGVSRTPMREALARLSAEGAVTGQPGVGFSVKPLSVEEVREIYPIRAFLDPEALRLSGIPSADRIRRLGALNAELLASRDARDAIRLDDDWFRELWRDCPNRVLIGLIEQFMWRTRRYELASMGRRGVIESTTDSKAEILDLLEAGDLEGACAEVRRSLERGAKPVLEWLERRRPVAASDTS
jgi:DNA-binding GntR family transcriptional regulator